jgi:hypothetical protein
MVNGGAKPNRRIEQLLHHGPVTAILDKTLIDEIRQLGDGTGKTVAEAHRTAMRMSLRLQTIATSQADRG